MLVVVVVLSLFGSRAGTHQGKGSVLRFGRLEMIVTTP